MISIKEAIIVEGKYDKMRLKSAVDATIIETNGFRIFKDKEKVNLIKQLAQKQGIIILTDSDSAGFLIRNHLRGIVPQEQIKNAYIPQIKGKEKRKDHPSKEGTLGVEGVDEDIILKALQNAGAVCGKENQELITKTDLYNLGLTGGEKSKILRTALLKQLKLPQYMSAKAMLEVLNTVTTPKELYTLVEKIKLSCNNA
ncbi:toprim domain-containing protein [Oscillospiraceae bacterium LCP25S3_E10]|nr:DUF4093 domain-containing protein [Ruminococcus sp.]MDD6447761.1 DUF4093 domain-containing protein [Ruminococcus sp.]